MTQDLEELNLEVAREWGWTEIMSIKNQFVGIPPEFEWLEYYQSTSTSNPPKRPVPNFIEDMNATWKIVKKYAHTSLSPLAHEWGFSNFTVIGYPDNGWCCMLGSCSDYGKTAGEAICRTFLEYKERERNSKYAR